MRIIVGKDYKEMSRKAANILSAQVILNPHSVIGLATGSTPQGMYAQLVDWYKKDDIDFAHVKTFNLDEYYGLDKNNPQSYYYFMNHHLFGHVNIKPENIHIPNGSAENIEKECQDYEEKIIHMGGIDLQVLGIGHNGHIGFNEPDVKFEQQTHFVNLDQNTIRANARFFDRIEDVPTQAISVGVKTIMHARKILLLCSGEDKAEILYKALKGEITPEVPASALQLHPDVTVVADTAAMKYFN
jgi:glucosamine-6-phosphate deaminase